MSNQTNRTKNIFLSDDDADDCMLFAEALQEIYDESQAKLTIVNDGIALMQVLDATVPPPPEVIFLDINMPKKNGVECLQEIRSTPKLAGIPIIIFSTSANKDIVDTTFEHGANYYICKPHSYLLLKKTIELVLSFDFERLNQRPVRESYVIKVA